MFEAAINVTCRSRHKGRDGVQCYAGGICSSAMSMSEQSTEDPVKSPEKDGFAVPTTKPKRKKKDEPATEAAPSTVTNYQSSTLMSAAPGQYGLWVPPEREKETSEGVNEETNAPQPVTEEAKSTQPKPSANDLRMYEAPFWSAVPKYKYKLELIKDGVSQGNRNVWKKPYYLIGRAPVCDIQLDHESVSRQHAVIQFRKSGTWNFLFC